MTFNTLYTVLPIGVMVLFGGAAWLVVRYLDRQLARERASHAAE